MKSIIFVGNSNLAKLALCSRLLVVILQVIFSIIPDHDAGVFNPPMADGPVLPLDRITAILLGGFKKWDAVYFLHIAEHGYTFENCLAFFPLYPFAVRFFASPLHILTTDILSYHFVLLLTGAVINMTMFVLSAVSFYHLSKAVLSSDSLAYFATTLYCFNPASIFFSACYSESLFALLTFTGMLSLEKKWMKTSTVLFGLSTATRSNGLVSLGFICYKQLCLVYEEVMLKTRNIVCVLLEVFPCTVAYMFVGIVPFLCYQYYAYRLYCDLDSVTKMPVHLQVYAKNKVLLRLGSEQPPWCNKTLPLSYSYVQSHYWNVGFLAYYTPRQIPNFLLAFPIVYITLKLIYIYFAKNFCYCIKLGFVRTSGTDCTGFFSERNFVYVVHTSFLIVVVIFVMHVQVGTRFLCSSTPVFYWFIAEYFSDCLRHVKRDKNEIFPPIKKMFRSVYHNSSTSQKFMLFYFFSYFIIGTGMHCNFFPWT